jgi:hypothetical protein
MASNMVIEATKTRPRKNKINPYMGALLVVVSVDFWLR